MIKYIVVFLIGAIAVLAVMCGTDRYHLPCGEIVKSDTVEIEKITIDTVWAVDSGSVIIDKPIPITTLPPIDTTIINDDSLRQYQGTKSFEFLTLSYDVFVSGRMETIRLGYVDNRPEIVKTIMKLKTITNTIVKPASGLYLGFELGSDFDNFHTASSSVYLLKKRHIINVSYDPFNKYASIGYGIKIF